jgi:putative transposase
MKSNLVHARTCVYNCNYHIVFTTKYRKKVLIPEIEQALQSLFQDIANDKGFIIHQAKVGNQDHIHVFASAHPKISPSYIAKMLKGISARMLFIKYPELKARLYKGHLWNPSYYVETIGSVSQEAIQKYIEDQDNG